MTFETFSPTVVPCSVYRPGVLGSTAHCDDIDDHLTVSTGFGLDTMSAGPHWRPDKDVDGSFNPPDDFVFIPITETEAARGRGPAKSIVRAHVTRVQHNKTRTQGSLQAVIPLRFVKPYTPHRLATRAEKLETSVIGTREASSSKIQDVSQDEGDSTSSDTDSQEFVAQATSHTIPASSPQQIQQSVLPRLPSGNHQEDPFWTFSIEYDPAISQLVAHYLQNLAVDIPDLDGPSQRGLLRHRWFPMAMTEPATMYALLLMAVSHFHAVNPSEVGMVEVLDMKARALAEINAAFADRSRATTDAMIGAVLKMAAYEAIFGDPSVYAAHMQGLRLMLSQRGGLGNLGLGGFLERLVVWVDLNAAHLTGCRRTLGGSDMPTVVEIDGPDLPHFAGTS